MDIKSWKIMLAVDDYGSFTRVGAELRIHTIRYYANDEKSGKKGRISTLYQRSPRYQTYK